ncbi:glycosyltransferase [Haloferula sp. BvORR071]|uniref:glycosyltransferase n=1 Tax=Haloferula sp. BvORR071 TaxID=1396141 RepID=UPI00054FA587|nr:glycosyltransferase [Haloferula sp. BvORR071]
MRCLWITRQDPRPANSGELIYSLGLLRSLAAQPGMEITVLAHQAIDPAGDAGVVEVVQRLATDPENPSLNLEAAKIMFERGGLLPATPYLQKARRDPHLGAEVAALLGEEDPGVMPDGQLSKGRRPLDWVLMGNIPGGRLKSLASALPSDAYRLGNPVQRELLKNFLGQQWDWIIIDQAACAWALSQIPASAKVLYLAHNHEASVRKQVAGDRGGSLHLRTALKWDAWKYARMELALARRANLISAITPRDAEAFRVDAPGVPVFVLPPGYGGQVPAGPPRPIVPETPRRVVLAGAFEWLAKQRNLEAFLQAAAAPFQAANIGFRVVGKADPAWFAALARQYPWASFQANVPSVTPYLDEARIGLIPEALGGGFKLKALDYIFRGLPLASVEAALSGVPVDPRSEAVAAPDPATLAAAVAAKIDDLDFLNHAASRALDACRSAFRWEDRGVTLARALGDPAACRP